MRDLGLAGAIGGKPVKTTVSDKGAACPLDRVNRQFQAPEPNRLWVADFTYVATWAGFVYVAFVIDAFARRIVGWRVSRTAHASFVLDALEQAIHARKPAKGSGLVHHRASAVSNTCRSNIPGAWPKPGSILRSAASATATTTRWPKRSTASTRPRRFTGAARGDRSRPSNTPGSGDGGGCARPMSGAGVIQRVGVREAAVVCTVTAGIYVGSLIVKWLQRGQGRPRKTWLDGRCSVIQPAS